MAKDQRTDERLVAEGSVSGAFSPELIALLDRLHLQPRSLAGSRVQGGRRSRTRGRSLEFSDFRTYAPGDDPRDIDWNAVARLDALMVRIFQAEVSLPVHLVADFSPSMYWGEGTSKIVQAARVAAVLAYVSSLSETHATLVGARGEPLASLRRSSGMKRLLLELDGLLADPPELVLSEVLARLLKRGAGQSVVLITDGYDAEGLLPGLKQLAARGAEVSMILVLHQDELQPSMEGEFELSDAESGAITRVSMTPEALREYAQRLERFLASWRRECRRMGASFAQVSCALSMQELCSSAMLESGLVARRRGG